MQAMSGEFYCSGCNEMCALSEGDYCKECRIRAAKETTATSCQSRDSCCTNRFDVAPIATALEFAEESSSEHDHSYERSPAEVTLLYHKSRPYAQRFKMGMTNGG